MKGKWWERETETGNRGTTKVVERRREKRTEKMRRKGKQNGKENGKENEGMAKVADDDDDENNSYEY